MRWIATLRLRLRSLFRSTRVERELDEEFQYHLARLEDEFRARGLSADEARAAASREMGAVEPRKEECRDARGVDLVEGTWRDLSYALRTLRKSPAFTTVAILSLALGIGANTAIFTLWNGVLRAPLPGVPNPEQLVMLTDPSERGSWTGRLDGVRPWLTYGEFQDLRDHADRFSALMASQSSLSVWPVRVGGDAEDAHGRLVSGGYFDVLGVKPAIGRLFSPDHDRSDAPFAVISHAYWQRRFGGRPDVLGTNLTVGKAALTIIGVTPPGFIGETTGTHPDLWVPLLMQSAVQPNRDRLHDSPPTKQMWLHVFGRLEPGVTPAEAEAQANSIFQGGLESFYGALAQGDRRREVLDQRLELRSASGGASVARRSLSQPLTALLAAVGVLLLIACANLANLLLARGAARTPEFALRLSLGASRGRLVRQLATESLALAMAAGVASIVVASVLHGALVAMLAQADDEFRMSFALDPLVLAFVVAAAVGAALVFGLLPAWQVTRTDAVASLRDHGRGAASAPGHQRSGRLLVSLQLALSLPLLMGAGLLVQTVYNLQHADLGYPAERLLLVRVNLADAGYDEGRRDAALGELVQQVRLIPGVHAVSLSQLGVFSGGESSATVRVDGHTSTPEDQDSATDVIGPEYFSTLGTPIVIGREILDSDVAGGPRVCVINEAFANHYFADRHPIGMGIALINEERDGERPEACRVVGVAGNARTSDLRGDIAPRFYRAARQSPSSVGAPTLLIRTAGDSTPVMGAVRRATQRFDAALPIVSYASIEEQMAPLTAQDRTTAQLVIVFGSVALTLAAIGLYGLLSYGIARRTGEIAVRIALGARPAGVTTMILRETVSLVVVGLAVGGGLAYAAARLIDGRLYGVAPQDPLTLAVATGLLLIVALCAAYWPARRASRLDPMVALRQ